MAGASAIAAVAGANNGTSPPGPTLSSLADDERGYISFGSGATPAAGAQVVLNTTGSWSGYDALPNPIATVTPCNAATAACGTWWASISSDNLTVTFGCSGIPAASQASGTFKLAYKLQG